MHAADAIVIFEELSNQSTGSQAPQDFTTESSSHMVSDSLEMTRELLLFTWNMARGLQHLIFIF